jgi:hypothetical protein
MASGSIAKANSEDSPDWIEATNGSFCHFDTLICVPQAMLGSTGQRVVPLNQALGFSKIKDPRRFDAKTKQAERVVGLHFKSLLDLSINVANVSFKNIN